ncbi:hypothetical protein SK128_011267 [Halocaridina rubra]|uniref:RING-type domain-containing protein n=1 Tax=Halocaridina rubra TaxID=373956 RepID=A0AAN8WLB6_HALRR
MATNPRDCPICDEAYNEENRRPRILNCSHTICTDCIDNILSEDEQLCPFCRSPFTANDATDLKVNQAVLDLIDYYEAGEHKVSDEVNSRSLMDSLNHYKTIAMGANQLQARNCQNVIQRLEKTIDAVEKLRLMKEQVKGRLEGEVTDHMKRIVSDNETSLTNLEQTKTELQNHLRDVHNKQDQLKTVKENIDSCTENNRTDFCKILGEAEDAHSSVLAGLKTIEENTDKEEKVLCKEKKKAEKMKYKVSELLDLLSSPM